MVLDAVYKEFDLYKKIEKSEKDILPGIFF